MKRLTESELLLLGLVAEMPRHGYELDQVIEQRGMRQWAHIAFSSIYFVLGKLERLGLTQSNSTVDGNPTSKSRKQFFITRLGRKTLAAQTLDALRDVQPPRSSVLLGMINWPSLSRADALHALRTRHASLQAEISRLREIAFVQQPLPDHVEALFDHSIGQMQAESEWVARTVSYMESKPWLDDGEQS